MKYIIYIECGLNFQVSNWFINARVRLWKPMVEEMYQQEAKDESGNEQDRDQSSGSAQTPTPATTTSATAITPPPPRRTTAPDNDPSFIAMNTHCFTDNQANQHHHTTNNVSTATSSAPPPSFSAMNEADQHADNNIGSTLIRFGTNAGDVSLTLGLRHAGNLPDKSSFSVRDFGGC